MEGITITISREEAETLYALIRDHAPANQELAEVEQMLLENLDG